MMKNKTRKLVQKLIDEQYLTDWEFVVEVIAPEIEEEEFNVEEICYMVGTEKLKREIENKTNDIRSDNE